MATFGGNGGPGSSGDGNDYQPNGMGNGSADGGMGSSNGEQKCTLWMGELESWMDETYVKNVFRTLTSNDVQVKIIRDKNTGNSGYCFVEFPTHEAASVALQSLNGRSIPNSSRTFKLNWASGGGINDRRDDRAPEFSIFVGDLSPDINEFILMNLFQARFASCKSAKIMTDNQTGQSRGYGFVRFSSEHDQQRALVEMQGVYCGNRPMRVSMATPKNRNAFNGPAGPMNHPAMHAGAGQQQMWGPQMGHSAYPNPGYPPAQFNSGGSQMNQFTDPNNTTVFVGGLSGYVTEDELRSFFQGFGDITYVKIPPGKGCGFVQFVHRHAAEMAINQMQGYPIGNSRVRLSWGRSQNNSGIGTPYRPAPPPPHYNPGHGGPHGPAGPYGHPGPSMAFGQGPYGGPMQGPHGHGGYNGHNAQQGPPGPNGNGFGGPGPNGNGGGFGGPGPQPPSQQ
jgi:RNA recognition motif-containing protein